MERQEHIFQAETAQLTDNSVLSVANTITMHHVAGPESYLERDLRRPREGESRKQQT